MLGAEQRLFGSFFAVERRCGTIWLGAYLVATYHPLFALLAG